MRDIRDTLTKGLEAASLGNPSLKMLMRLIAEGSMKARGPHRADYDRGRSMYAEREGWSLGHQHAAALRLTSKAILRDLWIATPKEIEQ